MNAINQAGSAIFGLALSALVATTGSIVHAQTYNVGTCCSPFGAVADAGEAKGYSVDVMNAIAADVGFDVEVTVFPSFSGLLPALLDGTIDIAAGPTSILTSRVEMGLAFSGVYARYSDMLLVLRTDTTPYTSVTEFSEEVIARQRALWARSFLRGIPPAARRHPRQGEDRAGQLVPQRSIRCSFVLLPRRGCHAI